MISEDKLGEIQDELEGTCTSISQIIDRHDLCIDEDDLEDQLLNQPKPIERCGGCEWWFSVTDLEFDESRGAGFCTQCESEDDA
ncbi:MAG: hypothetical protein LAT81_14445 [Oceanicaulis sp.]|nr:hypothetical protein [Oceanicaulis sp.]